MAEFFIYQKKRREFGKPCNFQETDTRHCGYFPTPGQVTTYKERNPNFISLDNISELSEHQVNTERVKTNDKGMGHREGGWPSSIDPTEPQETNKFRKRIEREQVFGVSVKELKDTIDKCIQQNNQIDLFEEYFQNETSEHIVEQLSSKTLMLFKDENDVCKRSVSEISWHPEGPHKLAASYSILRFQQMPDKMHTQSYIWDLQNPNHPEINLMSPSPVTNIMYNPKLVDTLGGGCYNGLLAVWDARKNGTPIMVSPVEKSHFDPITHFHWLQSRTGSECVTTSTDGRVMWWDTRKLEDGPTEILNITDNIAGEKEEIVGGTSLEFNVEAGPGKLLIGTESGTIMTTNKRLRKPVEITTRYGLEQGKHLGPVYSINRSIPTPKYFLSVGDWSCKVWVEDLKTPIIRTRYHGAYISDGCWSPTRNGAFFLVRRDGWMDVWDYYYRQNEIAFSHKVSECPLTCIKINGPSQGQAQQAGKLVAIGDQEGTVTILELCSSLYTPQNKEKDNIAEMFEREFRKEKNLEQIKKQQELAKKAAPRENVATKQRWEKKKEEMIKEVETEFSVLMDQIKKEQNQGQDLSQLDSPRNRKPDQSQPQPQDDKLQQSEEDPKQ